MGTAVLLEGSRAKDGVPYPEIHFNGTERLLVSISHVLPQTTVIKPIKLNLWRLRLSQKKAFAVLDWMYQESEGLRLEQKHVRYREAQAREGFYAISR